jgi:hypothetical protein
MPTIVLGSPDLTSVVRRLLSSRGRSTGRDRHIGGRPPATPGHARRRRPGFGKHLPGSAFPVARFFRPGLSARLRLDIVSRTWRDEEVPIGYTFTVVAHRVMV